MKRALAMILGVLAFSTPTLAFEPYAPERLEPQAWPVAPPPRDDGGMFPADERGFVLQLMVGPGYRNIHGIHMFGGDLEIALGAQTKSGGWHGRATLFAGRTPEGLGVVAPGLAPTWEAPLGPFRLGAGVHISVLGYFRATTGDFAGAIGIGPRLHGCWDFAKGEYVSGFLGLRGGIDPYVFGDSDTVSPNLALHVGFRVF